MYRTLISITALAVFAFGMSASMAQQPKQMDPGTIRVNPPQQPAQIQTQPTPIPNLNTSKNPYDQKRYLETPVQQPKR